MHGGLAAQNLQAARERIRDLTYPAIRTVAHLIEHADTDAIRLAASRYVLEVNGYKATEKVEQATEVVVRVSYADVGPAPPPGRARELRNGHALEDGR